MPNITLVISEELKRAMKQHPSVKWSNAVRNIIEQKLEDFREAESLAKKSKFNWKDWKLINVNISKSAARHAKALVHETDG